MCAKTTWICHGAPADVVHAARRHGRRSILSWANPGQAKSTMGSIMLVFNPPSEARCCFEGQDVATMNAAQCSIRKNVKPWFQDPPMPCFQPVLPGQSHAEIPIQKKFGLSKSKRLTPNRDGRRRAMRSASNQTSSESPPYPHQFVPGGPAPTPRRGPRLDCCRQSCGSRTSLSRWSMQLRASIPGPNIYDLKGQIRHLRSSYHHPPILAPPTHGQRLT